MDVIIDGFNVLIDDCDKAIVDMFSWHRNIKAGHEDLIYFKADGSKNNKRVHYSLHRLIIKAPLGLDVDHINGNTLDNRKCNLRICTHSENMHNRKMNKDNTTGYKGVSFHKASGKYRAMITIDGKEKWLGLYTTKELAYEAYCKEKYLNYGKCASY